MTIKPPREYTRFHLDPETEQARRIKICRVRGVHELADRLSACLDGARCRSAACALCTRRCFDRRLERLRAAWTMPSTATALTIILPNVRVAGGELRPSDAERSAKAFGRYLKRAGLGDLPVIAVLDVSLECTRFRWRAPRWQFHYHAMVLGLDDETIATRLRAVVPKTTEVGRPVLTKPAHDVGGWLAYMTKLRFLKRVTVGTTRGVEGRPDRFIDKSVEKFAAAPQAELLVFLDGLRPGARFLVRNPRRLGAVG